MFPFWEIAIAPVIEAVRARRVVEIGALRGDTTIRMLDRLGPDVELHVVDPLPQFDPAEHEQAFPGRYFFHRDLSHNVLPHLPPVDVALVDGDHNWYTVFHELRMLSETARAAGQMLPVLVLHDVGWPYGRRDLYYDPAQIPEEFRQPYRERGMHPDLKRLLPEGGLNDAMHNAEVEGGPRNGVMTALDDFMASYDRPLRRLVLPFYFGLAIVVEEDRLRATPELAAVFDRLTSADGREELLGVSEKIRLDEAIFVHNWIRLTNRKLEIGAARYLDVVKSALLDEHYLDNEVRIEYLATLAPGTEADLSALRDPPRLLPVRFQRLAQARRAGRSTDGPVNPAYFPYTDMGRPRLEHLEQSLRAIVDDDVPGDLAECGVGRGGGAIFLRAFLEAHDVPDRQVWVADPFVGSVPAADGEPDDVPTRLARFRADVTQVRDGFARFGLLDDRVRFLQGPFAETLQDDPIEQLALLRIGEGFRADIVGILERLHPLVAPGGVVIIEGADDARVEKEIAAARDRLRVTAPMERIDWNSVAWRVPAGAAEPAVAHETPGRSVSAPAPHRIPLAPPLPGDAVALTVVVVFYNMRREAARTLLSLSRSYQRGLDDVDYEVIAIDNGSDPDERLQADEVTAFGPEFRFVDLGADAAPSPTVALNHGIALARGEAIALMIDGAHVLTPGVLQLGLTALDTYEPAVVATQQWYVGPGQQGDAQHAGYDQQAEDLLFRRIRWPEDGYRLFEIGHFIGERDWFDGIVESNCLFVPRALLEQVGGFDDTFSMPGGGYANLDLFERLGSTPGVRAASILGEGTFHQIHGGTTTNVADADVRRDLVFSYGQHYRDTRGKALVGLTNPVHYVGAMATKAARRTRSRREIDLAFGPLRDPVDIELPPGPPPPVPDEVKLAAIEAVWDHQAWQEATWLGHRVARYPTDLHSYQELLAQVRPSWVVMIGDDPGLGGRALFAASICDQLDHGRVVAVGRSDASERPTHPRIDHLTGSAEEADVAAQVAAIVGEGADPDAVVFIGLGAVLRVVGAFELYAPLVPVGSYVVIENTVVNGRPVAPSFGPGPFEAAVHLLGQHREFVADPTFERYTLTFNRGGYLKRLAPS